MHIILNHPTEMTNLKAPANLMVQTQTSNELSGLAIHRYVS